MDRRANDTPRDRGTATPVPLASASGRWLVLAAVLGSGVAFLDGSVVNVALPAIGRDVGGGLSVLQWVLDGYLLTLSALLLLGGALGDRLGRRRIFAVGLVLFTIASLACGLAPNGGTLIAARLAQGAGGALLVPGSLALIDRSIRQEDRGRAIGVWAGLAGVASALGPFVGGYLVEAASWRWVFFINVPLAAVALAVTLRHVPESRNTSAVGRLDLPGAAAITLGLGGVILALIEVPARGWTALTITAGLVGVAGLVAFPLIEKRQQAPLLAMAMFRSRQFAGANLTTLVVYAALGGALFLLTLQLQLSLGYSPMAAGLATLPITVLMMLLSSRIGALAQRIGARLPMTIGPVVAGGGLVLLTLVQPGTGYVTHVLPGVLVFGLGLAITVAPLTATVLAAVSEDHVGAASGANNAISRIGGLLSVAVLPLVADLHTSGQGGLGNGYAAAMVISGVTCALGGVVAFFTIDRAVAIHGHTLPGVNHACQHPSTREPASATDAG